MTGNLDSGLATRLGLRDLNLKGRPRMPGPASEQGQLSQPEGLRLPGESERAKSGMDCLLKCRVHVMRVRELSQC